MKYYLSSIFSITILISGCSVHPADPKISMKPPKYVEQIPPHIGEKNYSYDGSLFGQGDNPLFSDRKAMKVNDIVTVVIDESTIQSSQGNKKISDDSRNNLEGGLFTSGGNNAAINSLTNKISGITNVGFKAGSKNSFTASGTNSRNEKFTATITARVIKILKNGNYFIEGSRELLLNGSKQLIQVSGVIRPYDIDQTNTIDSKYIADAKILYDTQGDIKEATRKPWGSKMVENVWPF